jgi:hypothetical protein
MGTGKFTEMEGFDSALAASGRSSEIPESADSYGWLIGSWELDVLHYVIDVTARGLKAEAHFGWVLEGRAVQEVWIMPPRSQRTTDPDRALNMCGTTIRVWDPLIQAWRVSLEPDGKTWKLEGEFRARRMR